MNCISLLLFACALPAYGTWPPDPIKSGGGHDALTELTEPVDTEKSFKKQMARFDVTMEPEYLDRALEIVKKSSDRDGTGKMIPESRAFKLKSFFYMFRAITESIDVNYIPKEARIRIRTNGKGSSQPLPEASPVSAKVPGPYLYDYIQSGLRVFRFKLRVDILDYIRKAYQGIPSPKDREEVLSLAQGMDAEFVAVLGDFMKTDVSWALVAKKKMPNEGTGDDRAAFLTNMSNCIRQMRFLERVIDPLYLTDDVACINICPPLFVEPDDVKSNEIQFVASGMSPDNLKNTESRRQYVIARHENERKCNGMILLRTLEDQSRGLQSTFWRQFKSAKLLDEPGICTLRQVAELAEMSDWFMDNFREADEMWKISAAVGRFAKGNDLRELEKASSLLNDFRVCKPGGKWRHHRMAGREFLDTFALERWLELFHTVASAPAFENAERIKSKLEDSIMAHIFKKNEKDLSGLMKARWWLKTYDMRKPLIEQVDQSIRDLLQQKKQEIENRLADVERHFTPEAFTEARRAVDRLTNCNSSTHKIRFDILDFKVCCQLRLLALLEGLMNPDCKFSPKEEMVLKTKSSPPPGGYDTGLQPKLEEWHRDCCDDLQGFWTVDGYGGGGEAAAAARKKVLHLLEKKQVTPEVLNKVKMKFDQCNSM